MSLKVFRFFVVAFVSCLWGDQIEWSSDVESISFAGANADLSKIKIDSNGNVVAVWIENDKVTAKTKLFNQNWTDSVLLSQSAASSLLLEMDGAGNVVAVWLENGLVTVAQKMFSQNWGSFRALSNSGATSPQISIDLNGNIVVVWVRNGVVESSTKLVDEDWPLTPDFIESADSASPEVRIGNDGTVVLLWYQSNQPNFVVYSVKKAINGSWQVPHQISDATINSISPKISVDSNGNAIAIWFTYQISGIQCSNVIVQTASMAKDEDWTSPVDLSDPGIGNPIDLSCLIKQDHYGNAVALWTASFTGFDFCLQSAVKQTSGSWSAPKTIVGPNFNCSSFDCVVLPMGSVLILCSVFDHSIERLAINSIQGCISSLRQNFWSAAQVISRGNSNSRVSISCAMNGESIYPYAIWSSYDGDTIGIQALSGLGITLLPPNQFTVIQEYTDYKLFKEFHNVLNWEMSLSENVKSYLLFRNGIFINEIDSKVTQFIDYNQHENEFVIYGIASTDDEQSQSITVNTSLAGN